MSDIKVAVISDIHGNADALNTVLEEIQLLVPDITIILGDLLTYGCQPLEVLDILNTYKESHHCVFIKGNHDQFYFDFDAGKKSFDYAVPKFVSESILWTVNKLNGVNLQSMFDWTESFSIDSIYFAHANPFQYGDWRYVESVENCLEASVALNKNGFKIGVFGHSHRSSAVQVSISYALSEVDGDCVSLEDGAIYVLNPGSIGQPRGKGLSFMVLTLNKSKLGLEFHRIDVDLSHSVSLISNSEMSFLTKEKLISYLGVNR